MSADLIGDDACREAFNKARQQRFSVHGLDVVCEPDIFRAGYAAGRDSEIAKRDETIARLEPQLNRAIQANYDLREELAACRVAVENCEVFRAQIAELEARIVWLECEAQVNAAPVSEAKAQEPDCDRSACGDFSPGPCDNPDCSARRDRTVVAPAAKAQGVVMPEPDIKTGHGYPAYSVAAVTELFARLNAAPAAPAADGWIPVSERLPEVESRLDQECRAGTLSIAPLNVSAAVLVFDGEKVRSTRLEWFDGCLPLPYCITHWVPLPAAPVAHSSKGVV